MIKVKKNKKYPDKRLAIKRFIDTVGRLNKVDQDFKVIDIGTRSGFGIRFFKKWFLDVSGTEVDREYVGYCQKEGMNVIYDDIEKTTLPANTYDIVYSFHVIEHVHDPVKFLNNAYEILKSPGYVCAYFPLTKKTTCQYEGPMKHRTFYKKINDFEERVVKKSKFSDKYILSQSRTKGVDGAKYSEGYFVGIKR